MARPERSRLYRIDPDVMRKRVCRAVCMILQKNDIDSRDVDAAKSLLDLCTALDSSAASTPDP